MFRNAEKPIPTCQEHELDSEDEELDDIAHAQAMAGLLPRLPPSEIQIDERTARRETLFPSEKLLTDWETLDGYETTATTNLTLVERG